MSTQIVQPEMPGSQVTRIDLFELSGDYAGQTRVNKYAKWQDGFDHLVERKITETMTFEEMVTWLETYGWVVFRWPGGARAFRPKPYPIRTRSQIIRLRERLTERKRRGDPRLADISLCQLDLAMYF